MKYIYSLFIILVLFFGIVRPSFAYSIPTFPNCPTPNGSLKVEYSSGLHAIPGESKLYEGSDKVYYTGNDNLVQCFCAPDGKGIQTNWWRIGSLTESEIQQLKNLGWHYIANGGAWGLDQTQYMAKNAEFSCNTSNGGSTTSNGTGGQILSSAASTTGQVLGLAATGNILTIYIYWILGLVLLISGILLRRKISNK